MNEQEKFLFDLQGYITVPDALSSSTLRVLNDLMDEHIAAEAQSDMKTHRFGRMLQRHSVYLELLDNPRITPYLQELLGDGFRLDHDYADVIRKGSKSPIGATLHGGGTPFNPLEFYVFRNGRMYNGLTVVAYNLKDVNPGDGGFACVPGSHKSNYRMPQEWLDLDNLQPCVRSVTGPAGTAIIFTEALMHGALPWESENERRTLFYKYSPRPISYSSRYYNADEYKGLTENQRKILRPPSH